MNSDAIWHHTALLWYCDNCNLWWVSEPTGHPYTWLLIRLSEPISDPLWKNRCPAWVVAGPQPSVCPECLAKMVTEPVTRQNPLAASQPPPEVLALFN